MAKQPPQANTSWHLAWSWWSHVITENWHFGCKHVLSREDWNIHACWDDRQGGDAKDWLQVEMPPRLNAFEIGQRGVAVPAMQCRQCSIASLWKVSDTDRLTACRIRFGKWLEPHRDQVWWAMKSRGRVDVRRTEPTWPYRETPKIIFGNWRLIGLVA